MAIAKIDQLDPKHIQLADIAKALSHPARLKILQVLADKSRCICGEIVDVLPLSQSTVSQHLKELKRVGLVDGEIDGPKTCYCLNYEKMRAAHLAFHDLFEKTTGCC